MHVAATNPVALDLGGVPSETLEREKAILADKNKGKPPQVLEKIVASGLKSYAKDNCLLDQSYIHDPSKTVTQVLKEAEGKVGAPVKIAGFRALRVGRRHREERGRFRRRGCRGGARLSLLSRAMRCSSLGESLVPALGRMRADGHRPPAPRL